MLNKLQLGCEDFFVVIGDESINLGKSGTIVAANKAWRQFCADNGGDLQTRYVGTYYFSISSSAREISGAEASVVSKGLLDDLENRTVLVTSMVLMHLVGRLTARGSRVVRFCRSSKLCRLA